MAKFMQTYNHYLNTTFTIIMAFITIPTHTICYQLLLYCNTFIFNIMKVSLYILGFFLFLLIHSSSFYVLAANVIMIIFFLDFNLCHCLLFSCFVYQYIIYFICLSFSSNIQVLNTIMVYIYVFLLPSESFSVSIFHSTEYFSKSICMDKNSEQSIEHVILVLFLLNQYQPTYM